MNADDGRVGERRVSEAEAIAAAVAVLAAVSGPAAAAEPVATRSVWSRRRAGWATGPDEWWASGQAG